MDHRELVLSARKKAKFHFLQLPEGLQDQIIAGLDSQELTLESARDLVSAEGHSLSHEAIAGYYRAVRRERRIYDASQELTRVVEQFHGADIEENARVFSNFLLATAVRKLADGEVGIKDVDLAKIIQAIANVEKAKLAAKPAAAEKAEKSSQEEPEEKPINTEPGMSGELADWVRREVLGVRRPADG